MRPKANTGKTGGFQRGPVPPLWHTTLLARCSVLYLLVRLAGKTGVSCLATHLFLPTRKWTDFCEWK